MSDYQPGEVAIATVRGVERVAFRLRDGLWALAETGDDEGWLTAVDEIVTITSRAIVVTEADRDELIERFNSPGDRHFGEVIAEDIREWFAAKLGGA